MSFCSVKQLMKRTFANIFKDMATLYTNRKLNTANVRRNYPDDMYVKQSYMSSRWHNYLMFFIEMNKSHLTFFFDLYKFKIKVI